MSRFEWVRHPDAPACEGCGRPIAPGTITPDGKRHFGCDGKSRSTLPVFWRDYIAGTVRP